MGKSRFWSEKHDFDAAILEMFDSDMVPRAWLGYVLFVSGPDHRDESAVRFNLFLESRDDLYTGPLQ